MIEIARQRLRSAEPTTVFWLVRATAIALMSTGLGWLLFPLGQMAWQILAAAGVGLAIGALASRLTRGRSRRSTLARYSVGDVDTRTFLGVLEKAGREGFVTGTLTLSAVVVLVAAAACAAFPGIAPAIASASALVSVAGIALVGLRGQARGWALKPAVPASLMLDQQRNDAALERFFAGWTAAGRTLALRRAVIEMPDAPPAARQILAAEMAPEAMYVSSRFDWQRPAGDWRLRAAGITPVLAVMAATFLLTLLVVVLFSAADRPSLPELDDRLPAASSAPEAPDTPSDPATENPADGADQAGQNDAAQAGSGSAGDTDGNADDGGSGGQGASQDDTGGAGQGNDGANPGSAAGDAPPQPGEGGTEDGPGPTGPSDQQGQGDAAGNDGDAAEGQDAAAETGGQAQVPGAAGQGDDGTASAPGADGTGAGTEEGAAPQPVEPGPGQTGPSDQPPSTQDPGEATGDQEIAAGDDAPATGEAGQGGETPDASSDGDLPSDASPDPSTAGSGDPTGQVMAQGPQDANPPMPPPEIDTSPPQPPADRGGEDISAMSAAQLFAEPGSVPATVEMRLDPPAEITSSPAEAVPPRQLLPAWINELVN